MDHKTIYGVTVADIPIIANVFLKKCNFVELRTVQNKERLGKPSPSLLKKAILQGNIKINNLQLHKKSPQA